MFKYCDGAPDQALVSVVRSYIMLLRLKVCTQLVGQS